MDFETRGKTPRRATDVLLALAADDGYALADVAHPPAPGAAFAIRLGPSAVAFYRPGAAAASAATGDATPDGGLDIVVAPLDAPRLDLKPHPVYAKEGTVLLDTLAYGPVDPQAWLAQPLALYVHADRAGGGQPLDLAIGDAPGDPILDIPDLLPHLSYGADGKTIAAKLEQLDPIAGLEPAGEPPTDHDLGVLTTLGLTSTDVEVGELSLVPAGPPHLVGVDRGLLLSYGIQGRALAYAAVKALHDAPRTRPVLVVLCDGSYEDWSGPDGLAVVGRAVREALALSLGDADDFGVRRVLARSLAIVGSPVSGAKVGKGIAMSSRTDLSGPSAQRDVLDALEASSVRVQLVAGDVGWTDASRELGDLNLDAIDLAVPVSGDGAPLELASTFDLYSAYLACAALYSRP
jgi:aspartyl aminopeptidase